MVIFERDRLHARFKSGFLLSFRLEIITDTDHEKSCVEMDLAISQNINHTAKNNIE